MPLTLDEDSLDRLADRPLYKQLADRIRAAIQNRDLDPGDALPSEPELADTLRVSRDAVRQALNVLVTEGLIVKQRGSGTRVAPHRRRRHMATWRYKRERDLLDHLDETGEEHPETSAFVEDFKVEWKAYRVQTDYRVEPADEVDAQHLRLEQGTPVLRRRLLKYVEGEPVQIQTSVMPLDLVAGTPVADPKRQPWRGGTMAELHSLHQYVVRVSERAFARNPTPEERRQLRMEAMGPVMDVVRVFSAVPKQRGEKPAGERRPVEYSTVVVAASTIVLEWETDLD